MKTSKLFIFLFLLSFVITLPSCKKVIDKPADANTASDYTAGENAFSGILNYINKVAIDSSYLRSAYPIITISSSIDTVYPKTLTIDFGPSNVVCGDLVSRKGKLTAVFTGAFTKAGSSVTITTTNYYHNNYKVQGTQIITNKGKNSDGHFVYNVVVNSASITNTSGGTFTWSTNQEREWFSGDATPSDFSDDTFLVGGTANGTSIGGKSYSIVITNRLSISSSCPWIVSGKLTLTMNTYPDFPILFDYGPGVCDANATASIDGTTYSIVMN